MPNEIDYSNRTAIISTTPIILPRRIENIETPSLINLADEAPPKYQERGLATASLLFVLG
jgi:hypothetical protein